LFYSGKNISLNPSIFTVIAGPQLLNVV
jgi:hypothetical protein